MAVHKEMIASIVSEILGQLGHGHSLRRLLVIGSRADVEDMERLLDPEYQYQLLFADEQGARDGFDRYVLPRLELNDMADLAQGRAESGTAATVRELLLAGRTVEVAAYAYTTYEATAQPSLHQLYRQYDQTLQTFGLVPMTPVTRQERLNKHLISEQDLKSCRAQGLRYVRIPAKAVVTALGADYAREHGIEIQRGA